jgi:hypothetical protein
MGKMAEDAKEKLSRDSAALYALLDNWRGRLENYAKGHASWTDRTGTARRSIHGGVEKHSNHMILYLAHGVKYAAFFETGTGVHGPEKRPIIIKPVKAKMLHWKGPDGKDHFAKVVKNPGMVAQPIIVPTLDTHIGKITRDVRELFGG